MEKNRNPNSWSELPLDLLNLAFQRLSFANFQRAKSACSSWYSASRQTVPKNQIPWLMLFPKDKNKDSSSCKLFNPEEKDKLYKTQDLGVEFAKSVCKATYGSWLLMQDTKCNLYMLNPFTRETINLPPVESQLGIEIERTTVNWFRFYHSTVSVDLSVSSPVFWIDEDSKDYIVLWKLQDWCVVFAKKGDNSWNPIPETSNLCDIVYKDHKLYFLSNNGTFKILDFSGVMENKTFKIVVVCSCTGGSYSSSGPPRLSNSWWCLTESKLVVTITGKVLKVEKLWSPSSGTWSFRVIKISPSGYEIVDSLGDEAMLLDLGITVPANDIEGINKNSIYFSGGGHIEKNTIFLFNLETQKMERLHKFACSSSLQLSRARWFLPSFTHK
ncbi:PREDICTED: probable F-box protein At4g22165 [Camelina sativa]|uniref:Probable F-box protein At4g22165 n=1 Tax=Camelina sativa TaxID=90675 RepID=A0ABM0V5W0_CAMSA|nr:PREDICTED: probable F-box protein At4g22165 [Camelina sativa]